jgi:hypothetical protein
MGLPERVLIAESLLRVTENVFTGRSHDQHEDVLYWAGCDLGGTWVLTTCIRPGATTTEGSFRTSAADNARVVAYVAKHRLSLLAQVHTHPDHRVGHSHGDDLGAFMRFEGYLSFVVPYYGSHGILPFSACGVHQSQGQQFRRLRVREVETLFEVLPIGVDYREQR